MVWNPIAAVGFVVLVPGQIWGWRMGLLCGAALVVILGAMLVRHRLVVTPTTVRFGARSCSIADVRRVRGREHPIVRGQPIGLVFDLRDGSSISWPWISYRRTTGGNLTKQDLLSRNDQQYLQRLTRPFQEAGAEVRLPAFQD